MERVPAVMTVAAIRTPRAAAVAGIIFSVLFAASTVLTAWAIPPGSEDAGTWVHDEARRDAATLSLLLLPFAGIAFLWFIGVLHDRIGQHEDRFFATVFLGSGLLFVGTFFVAGSLAAGLISTAADARPVGRLDPCGRSAPGRGDVGDGLRAAHGGRLHDLGDDHRVATAARAPLARPARLRDSSEPVVRGRCRAVGRADLPWLGVRTERPHPRGRVPFQASRERRSRLR